MDSTTANRVIAIGLFFTAVVAAAFAFFQLTGGFREIRLPGASFHFDDEIVARPPVRLRPPEPTVRRAPDFVREPFRPSTEAEKASYAAVEKADRLKARVQARRAETDRLKEFLSSEAGRQFASALELARAGKFDEARPIMDKTVEGLADQDSRVRAFVFKSAIQVYQKANDRPGLKRLLERYLDMLTEELSRTDLEPRQKETASEMLDKIQETVRELEAEAR